MAKIHKIHHVGMGTTDVNCKSKSETPPIFITMTKMTSQNLDSRKEHSNDLEPHIDKYISYDQNVYVIF
jgi:hypothetical protein